jgi:hypothetical protein
MLRVPLLLLLLLLVGAAIAAPACTLHTTLQEAPRGGAAWWWLKPAVSDVSFAIERFSAASSDTDATHSIVALVDKPQAADEDHEDASSGVVLACAASAVGSSCRVSSWRGAETLSDFATALADKTDTTALSFFLDDSDATSTELLSAGNDVLGTVATACGLAQGGASTVMKVTVSCSVQGSKGCKRLAGQYIISAAASPSKAFAGVDGLLGQLWTVTVSRWWAGWAVIVVYIAIKFVMSRPAKVKVA